jgi:general L-amino acid transport system permease protein
VGRSLARTLAAGLAALLALPLVAPAVGALTGSSALADLAAAHAAGAPWFAAALAALVAGRFAGHRLGGLGLRAAWLLLLPTVVLLLRGAGPAGAARQVPSLEWGGLLLTLLLATVAIALSFPLGIVLALGRRSGLPLVRALSVAYIELIRGVPLISVLFMARVMAPLVLPGGMRPDDVLRAVIGFTLFSAAYTAENVRGGLAAIPRGQYDASAAIGLGTAGTYRLVILPQALRAVIPALVGQFISLFKDTSLVAIVGLNELLGTALQIVNNPDYLGLYRETFAYIAVIYFVISYAMSSASRRLESALGVGAP